MKFSLIGEEKTHHAVSRTSGVLGSSRAGCHASRNRGPSRRRSEDEELENLMAEIHRPSFPAYGAPRIQKELAQARGIHVGRKRVARLMREMGAEGISRRKERRGARTRRRRRPSPTW
ncbi:IS3 family transposase [Candidatus Solincola tengchongensis]|uniref:IS3 family transposase n=1 Tax=Candidatus Solincola tengchongensis TaxID=2900693 RepID=UPI002579A952|nr:IS3 family transposase [Candidatus Solincola tengchongensis]